MNRRPLIALLTDFGLSDQYVASMKGVIGTIAPATRVVDLSHEVLPQHVRQAAYLLWSCYRYFPPGTIFVAVVDPGVGTRRKILCLEAGGYRFLAPDNGLLEMALESTRDAKIVSVENNRYFLKHISPTFQGRDQFAPVAAHLSNGVPAGRLGPRTTPSGGGEPLLMPVRRRGRNYDGAILHIDHFGNIVTNFQMKPALARSLALKMGRRMVRRFVRTYMQAPERTPAAIIGSTGLLEVSVRNGSAARVLRARIGGKLTLSVP
ncbi:MAG TPA: SAM-dependent chlorinase/fluorinase [Bacteroidota bacterium]